MLKAQIDQILNKQKLTSISDIVHFVIEQVSKSVNFDPLQQIHYRLVDLQKPKGLDSIMIEEVKTIVEAMLDQREFSIRTDIDKNINDHFEIVENIIQKNTSANSRVSLAQLDLFNYENTKNSRQNLSLYQSKNFFASQKNFKLDQKLQSLCNDQFSTKKQLKDQKKDILQLKMNLMSLQKDISGKVSLQQTEKLMARFQQQIFQKLNKQKIQWQKVQFRLMKQINEQIVQVRKQIKQSPVYRQIYQNIDKVKQKMEKYQKKLKKLVQQNKNSVKILSNFQAKTQKMQRHEEQVKKALLESQKQIKKIENDTLQQISQLQQFLEDISQKLNLFDQIQKLNVQNLKIKQQTAHIRQLTIKGAWLTQMKLKNSMICWQREITQNQNFKFEAHKSQILINQPGVYQFSIHLNQPKNCKNGFCGLLLVSSQPTQKYQIKLQAKSCTNMITKVIEIRQKSFFSIKADQNDLFEGKAYLQIKKI